MCNLQGDAMTTEERIDEMCRQLLTTKYKSKQKRRDWLRGIANAERKRRREKRKKENCIFI